MTAADDIIREFGDLKTLPHVALKVTQLVNDENTVVQDFEEIIALDPVLVSRLLRLVNSPYFGLARKVESISKAIVFVGMKQLRNLVAVESLRTLFKGDGKGFSTQNLWLHSATVAILGGMIARRIFGQEGEDVFLAGVIHDIGLIVEHQVARDRLDEACRAYRNGNRTLIECERDVFGTDHAEVGYRLAKSWNFPKEVAESIRCHHLPCKRGQPVSGAGSILRLCEFIAAKMKYWAVPGPVEALCPELAQHVKGMAADYKIIIRDLPGELAKARELYETEE